MKSRNSFTLIELIITISIIGILAAAVVIIINPAQLLEQGRDSKRISDLNSLSQAISAYIYQGPGLTGLGSANTVYVSLPDTTSTCANLNLPTLPLGWSYHCVTQENLFNVDGSGWMPINLNQMAGGSPISVLPVDPTNSPSNGEYYTYAVSASSTYELTAHVESNKYQSTAASDGGPDPTTYELGSGLAVTPFLHGLVGYWSFNGASGGLNSAAADLSGWGNNGTLLDATSTGTGPTYTTSGCLSGGCLSFDGTDDFVRILNSASINPNASNFAVNVWFYANSVGSGILYNKENMYEAEVVTGYAWQPDWAWFGGGNLNSIANQWIMMTVVYDHANQYLYRNGVLAYSRPQTGNMGTDTNNLTFGSRQNGTSDFFKGLLDDISIYSSALTAAQVQAIYNAEKPQ